jgi:ferrous iron transport protein B
MMKLTVGLIGNPNCGKTTLFNALTDSNQRVGNWPGVTVECESGYFEFAGYLVKVVDLPGIYSVSVANQNGSIDEQITAEYLLSDEAKIFVNVLDANNLERSLYLTSQLLELNIPTIIVVNMMDVAKRRKMVVDVSKLEAITGCEVVTLVASKNEGIEKLKKVITSPDIFSRKRNANFIIYPSKINEAIAAISAQLFESHRYFRAIRFLEDDVLTKQMESPETLISIEQIKKSVKMELKEDADILIADARYGAIHKLIEQMVNKTEAKRTTITTYIDRLILNRILGLPIFFLIMYAIFYFAIEIGGIFQNYFQIASDAIFVHGFAQILMVWHTPVWLMTILVSGIGRGINTTITFIPVLAMMFFILGVLEHSGYMARAGFVVDRLMRAVGLPGKSFVPMMIGFGCNVPAIMAARTLETQRDRILTIMMSPFMSCGARLATYAVFTAAFFPNGAQNVVFSLYVIGIAIAIITGLVLRKTLLQGVPSFLIMELPVYYLPKLSGVLIQTWLRLKGFLFKAGKIIIPFCLLLSVFNAIEIKTKLTSHDTLLAVVGKKITPLFAPMGITQDNWPAAVGLVSGIASKEVVVATLNTLYSQESKVELIKPLKITEKKSLPTIYGKMFKKFNGSIGAFTYLLFVLLYFPCIPALATMFRELDWRWAGFSVLWNTGLAYGVAVVFYQIATFLKHPLSATRFIAAIIAAFIAVILLMRKYGKGEMV